MTLATIPDAIEAFLMTESAGALIQTSGRAARNIHGQVIMYADRTTDSMRFAISTSPSRVRSAIDPAWRR